MSNNGWIKLHRQITDNVLWLDDEPFDRRSAWIDLLLMVNHEERQIIVNGQVMTVERGQTLTSEVKLAKRWHWSRDRVRRYLSALEAAKMAHVNRTRYGTWLNVVNYTFFQDRATTNKTTNDTTVETTNKTTDKTTGKTQTRSKEYKNDKKEREGQAPHSPFRPSEEFVRQYCSNHNLKINVDRFMAYYGARDWTLGKGMKVERPDQLEQLIKSWSSTEIDEKPESKELVNTMPAYQEFAHTPVELGEEPKFEGGVVAELLRRKRMKNA